MKNKYLSLKNHFAQTIVDQKYFFQTRRSYKSRHQNSVNKEEIFS